jgi:uncharacterized protein YecT (DUF1311 family)
MRLTMKNFTLMALCVYSTCGNAASPEYKRCIEWGVKFTYECAKSEYEHHSKRLKNALNSLSNISYVNKNETQKQHNKWLKYRNEVCSKNSETDSSFTYWQHCLARMTETRANEIEKIAKKR